MMTNQEKAHPRRYFAQRFPYGGKKDVKTKHAQTIRQVHYPDDSG
jgi:hypothetical protein